jgi:transposase
VLHKFKEWLDFNYARQKTLPDLLATAVKYAYNQWPKLINYLLEAELTPDNNEAERTVRPFTVGRKNWLFYKCPEGAESGCRMYSLIETAKLNELNPQKYLEYVFEKIPLAASREDWEALLPWNLKDKLQ